MGLEGGGVKGIHSFVFNIVFLVLFLHFKEFLTVSPR